VRASNANSVLGSMLTMLFIHERNPIIELSGNATVTMLKSAFKPDTGANEKLYGRKESPEDILIKDKGFVPAAAKVLDRTLEIFSPRSSSIRGDRFQIKITMGSDVARTCCLGPRPSSIQYAQGRPKQRVCATPLLFSKDYGPQNRNFSIPSQPIMSCARHQDENR
jgi:hypothetical protein